MAEILNQQEIQELLSAISVSDVTPSWDEPLPKVRRVDFHHHLFLTCAQQRRLMRIHHAFAREIIPLLQLQLRAFVSISCSSLDLMTFEEYTRFLGEHSFSAVVAMFPLTGKAVLAMTHSVSYAVINRLFGGQGKADAENRDHSAVETAVLEEIVKHLLPELRNPWREIVEIEPAVESVHPNHREIAGIGLNENVAVVIFEVRIGAIDGFMTLCLPACALEPILERLNDFPGIFPHDAAGEISRAICSCSYAKSLFYTHATPPLQASDLRRLRRGSIIAASSFPEGHIRFEFRESAPEAGDSPVPVASPGPRALFSRIAGHFSSLRRGKAAGPELTLHERSDPSTTRHEGKHILNLTNALRELKVRNETSFAPCDTEQIAIPLSLRIADGFIAADALPAQRRSAPSLSDLAGRQGELLLGESPIAGVNVTTGHNGRIRFEVLHIFSADPKMPLPFSDLMLRHPFTLALEAGRGRIAPEKAASLGEGDFLSIGPFTGEDFPLILEEYDIEIARAEFISIGETTGMRIKTIRIADLPSAIFRRIGAAERPEHADASIPFRCILERKRTCLKEILSLGEGSVIGCGRPIGEFAELLIGMGHSCKASIEYDDAGSAYARIAHSRLRSRPENMPERTDTDLADPAEQKGDHEPPDGQTIPEWLEEKEAILRTPVFLGDGSQLTIRSLDSAIYALRSLDSESAGFALLGIGTDKAAIILSGLADAETAAITDMMTRQDCISAEERDSALCKFREHTENYDAYRAGGIDYARVVLERGLGTEKAIEIINRLTALLRVQPFYDVRNADPDYLLTCIQGEHMQTIAMILSFLEHDKAAAIIDMIREDLQPDIITRIATLDRTSPHILSIAENVIDAQLRKGAEEYFSSGGITAARDTLNKTSARSETNILMTMEQENPDLAAEFRRRMTGFEDFMNLDSESLSRILAMTDSATIIKALQGAAPPVQEVFLSSLEESRRAFVKDAMDRLQPFTEQDTSEARTEMGRLLRRSTMERSVVRKESADE